jgi:hypothetical protein
LSTSVSDITFLVVSRAPDMKCSLGPRDSHLEAYALEEVHYETMNQPWWRSAEAGLAASSTSTERRSVFPLNKKRKRTTAICFTAILLAVFVVFLRSDARLDLELRHPLSMLRRTKAIEPDQIRYISFGSSSTWGEGLQDPLTASYPYRLSPQAHNAASRVGGSAMSAACTQSIVGDSVYDAVTIEFSEFDDSLIVLAQRIRQRLPAASIIFVRLWNPEMIRYRADNGEPIDLNAWRQQHGSYSLNSKELHTNILATEKERWFMEVPDDAQLEQTLQEVQGKLYTPPYPRSDNDFSAFTAMFQDENWSLLSKSGHEVVAEAIRDLVQGDSVLERPNRNETGSWGSGDQCTMWYADGNYAQEHRQARQVDFAHEAGSHKHALEILRAGGSVTINNPFPKYRMLSLTYMTASDEELGQPEYPRVRVRLGGVPSVAIEPYHEETDQVHLARTTAVGLIPPGDTLIQLDPLQDSKHNFRLVGVSILGEEIGDVPIDFALEQESAAGESGSLARVLLSLTIA